MKKIMFLVMAALLCVSFSACGGSAKNRTQQGSSEQELSGINAEVSKTDRARGTEYTFAGYFTTVVPKSVTAEDISIHQDSTLFSFSEDDITLLDVSFAEQLQSEEEAVAKAKELAAIDGASAVEPIKIDGVSFYGAFLPGYGMTRYIGFVGEQDVTLSVYTDMENDVVKQFMKNTVFSLD